MFFWLKMTIFDGELFVINWFVEEYFIACAPLINPFVFVTSTNEWNCWRYFERIVGVNGTAGAFTAFKSWLKIDIIEDKLPIKKLFLFTQKSMVERELKRKREGYNKCWCKLKQLINRKRYSGLIDTVYINLTTPIIAWSFNMNDFTAMCFGYLREKKKEKTNSLRVIDNGKVGIGGDMPLVVMAIASERRVGGRVCGSGIFFWT